MAAVQTLPLWVGLQTTYDGLVTKQPGIIYYAEQATGGYITYLNDARIDFQVSFNYMMPSVAVAKPGVIYLVMEPAPAQLYYFDGVDYRPIGSTAVPEVMEYMGAADASLPIPNPNWTVSTAGNVYIVTVAGTLEGKPVKVGDWAVFNKDASHPMEPTDFDVVSAGAIELANNLTTTTSGAQALDAAQGPVIKALIDGKANTVPGGAGHVPVLDGTGQLVDAGLHVITSVTDDPDTPNSLVSQAALIGALVLGTF